MKFQKQIQQLATISGLGLLSGIVGAAGAATGAAIVIKISPDNALAGILGAIGGTYIGLKAAHGAYPFVHEGQD